MIINRQSEDAIIYGKINKGPIVYFFDGGSPSRHKQRFCILMEYFLEGIAVNERSNKYKYFLLS